jgi:hypothetical protein
MAWRTLAIDQLIIADLLTRDPEIGVHDACCSSHGWDCTTNDPLRLNHAHLENPKRLTCNATESEHHAGDRFCLLKRCSAHDRVGDQPERHQNAVPAADAEADAFQAGLFRDSHLQQAGRALPRFGHQGSQAAVRKGDRLAERTTASAAC